MNIGEHIKNLIDKLVMAKCIDTGVVAVDVEDLEPVLKELEILKEENETLKEELWELKCNLEEKEWQE